MPAAGSDVTQLIGSVPFFAGLDKKQIKSLVEAGKQRSFNGGDKIVSEGDMGIGFYLILEGKVEVRKGSRVLATLSKGQYFGEMSLIDTESRSADVFAVEPAKCFLLTQWVFIALVKSNSEIALGMLKEMAKRLRAVQSSMG